jgi:hypothetical protein
MNLNLTPVDVAKTMLEDAQFTSSSIAAYTV